MSTPAERLLKAADLLEKRASEAAPDWRIDDDNHLALVSITTPAMVGLTRTSRRYSFTGPNDATTMYIATMHPGVGTLLASWLKSEGEATQRGGGRGFNRSSLHPADPNALALADLVLAGEQEQT